VNYTDRTTDKLRGLSPRVNYTDRPTDSEFKSINQKMHIAGILCDLAKVCDCKEHDILLAKLHFYGI